MARKNTVGAGRPAEYSRELPCYDTMEQCSAKTGVPIACLKLAKKQGCDGFSPGGRIHFSEFIKWWFKQGDKLESNDPDKDVDWGIRDKRATALMREAKLQEQYERVIDFGVAAKFVNRLIGTFFSNYERWRQEFPASAKGKTEQEIEEECVIQETRAKDSCEQTVRVWIDTKGKSQ